MNAIEVDHLSYVLPKKDILRDVSFRVLKGECLSIIGPNGAGKSTLLKCINRILRLSQGTISVNGTPLDEYTQPQLAQQLGYVPQADSSFLPFTAFEFVLMGRYPHLSPFSTVSRRDKEIAHEALRQTNADDLAERSLNTLSGGERQKVFIAAALAQEAEILLFDEPTTFLDYKHQVEIAKLMKQMNQREGMTLVSVTHDINAALHLGGQILALKEGEIAFQGSAESLLDDDTLEGIYGTPFHRIDDPDGGGQIIQPTHGTS